MARPQNAQQVYEHIRKTMAKAVIGISNYSRVLDEEIAKAKQLSPFMQGKTAMDSLLYREDLRGDGIRAEIARGKPTRSRILGCGI